MPDCFMTFLLFLVVFFFCSYGYQGKSDEEKMQDEIDDLKRKVRDLKGDD